MAGHFAETCNVYISPSFLKVSVELIFTSIHFNYFLQTIFQAIYHGSTMIYVQTKNGDIYGGIAGQGCYARQLTQHFRHNYREAR